MRGVQNVVEYEGGWGAMAAEGCLWRDGAPAAAAVTERGSARSVGCAVVSGCRDTNPVSSPRDGIRAGGRQWWPGYESRRFAT